MMGVISDADAGVRIERAGDGVVGLWLDRPARRNALHRPAVTALATALEDPWARAFVLGSTDPRAFSGGADLSLDDGERAAVSDLLYDLYGRMLNARAPIIVAVQGPAVGGGAQLALASDLRIGGPEAMLRFVGPSHGLAVGAWGLPSLIGRGRAADLCLTMRPVGATEALRLGLVDRLEPDPVDAALDLARSLAMLDAGVVARVKSVIATAAGTRAALAEERVANRLSWSGSVAGLAPPKEGAS